MEQAIRHLDRFIAQFMQESNVPGMALALTDRRQLLHVAAYGYADVAARIPVTADTLFEIGSIGKSFTAIGLLNQVEAECLILHVPITEYLPWFSIRSEFGSITVHHLLSHTAGLPMGGDFAAGSLYEVVALRDCETGFAPGEQFCYSNVGYKLLGHLLHVLAGQPYATVLREQIFDPLGMEASAPIVTNALRSRLAVGYVPFFDDRPWPSGYPQAPGTWLEYELGDGSPACTAGDLAAYLRMLLNRGQGPTCPILSEASFALLTQPVIPVLAAGPGISYAYGLVVGNDPVQAGHQVLLHHGGSIGYSATMLGDLDDGLGVVLLLNTINGPDTWRQIAPFALQTLRAHRTGQSLPSVPLPVDVYQVENAEAYVGSYHGGDREFVVTAADDRLTMQYAGVQLPLERRGDGVFHVEHPDFALADLRFGREGGSVVEAFHNSAWFTNERYSGPTSFDLPEEWQAYLGHYRSNNPWFSNFRIIQRKGQLLLVWHGNWERVLTPLSEGRFRVGKDEFSPDRLHFDTILDGQAMRAIHTAAEYYRIAIP